MKITDYIEQVKAGRSNYYLQCLQFAKVYIQRYKVFTSEDIIEAYLSENQHKTPAEPRVWGAVIRELQRMNVIKHKGFSRYKKPCGHGKPCNVWESDLTSS